MIIKIKNLRLRSLIGIHPWERREKQAVILNCKIEFDGSKAALSDALEDTIDYSALSRRIIEHVESAEYQLIERMAAVILNMIMADERVLSAVVEIDKPVAIKSADSTAVEVSASRASNNLTI